MPEQVEGDVFEQVPVPEITSMKQVDTKNLVANSHFKMEVEKGVEFILHPGEKVTKKVIDAILNDVHMGEETFLELVRRNSFMHKDQYVPDPETFKGAVEAYNQPIYRNQGSPEGDPSPDLGNAETPAKPAEDKSTTPDPEAEADVAAKAAAEAAGQAGKDTPPKK